MKKFEKILVLVFFLLSSHFTLAADPEVKIQLTFSPAGSFELVSKKLRGHVIKKDGKLSADKLSVRIQSFSSGIDLRDQHFWKHMNYKEHSKAILTDVKGENGKATGNLQVNGVKKNINIDYTENKNEYVAQFKIKASEFSLPPKSFLGITVDDEVSIKASGFFVKK